MSINDLFSEAKEVELRGVKIKIKQVSLGDLPVVTEVFSKLLDQKKSIQDNAIHLINKDFPLVLKIIAKLTDLDESALPQLSLDAALFVLTEIAKENASFLASRLKPQIENLNKEMSGLV